MGNGASCVSLSTGKAVAPAAAARLVGPDGAVLSVPTPVGVAEIMMLYPGHAVERADEVLRTRRAAGMRAEEELLPGAAYVVVPIDRVGSRLSDSQLGELRDAVGRRRGRCGGGGRRRRRVSPEAAGAEREGKDRKVAGLGGQVTGLPGKRVGGCRQWRPALDTIPESMS